MSWDSKFDLKLLLILNSIATTVIQLSRDTQLIIGQPVDVNTKLYDLAKFRTSKNNSAIKSI